MPGADYGEDMIRHWLLGELRASTENVELEGGRHFYRGNRADYLIDIVVTPVSKTVRLSED